MKTKFTRKYLKYECKTQFFRLAYVKNVHLS